MVPHENLYNNNENMDKTETLYCHNCYPECSHVKYNAKIAMSGLESNQHVAEVL